MNETLASISFQRSVIEINSFFECKVLKEALFSPNSRLQIVGGFLKCPLLSRVDIPASIERIGECSFSECTSLSEVTAPEKD
jgi:hypothetical protein